MRRAPLHMWWEGQSATLVASLVGLGIALHISACQGLADRNTPPHFSSLTVSQLDDEQFSQILSSPSGIVSTAAGLEVIGDDSPAWVTLDAEYRLKRSLNFWHHDILPNGRIDPVKKPDFEALTLLHWQGDTWKVALSSGSLPGSRDWALVWNHRGPALEPRAMTQLYTVLRRAAARVGVASINIEGLAASDHEVFLANRVNSGKNLLFRFPLAVFVASLLEPSAPLAEIQALPVLLPALSGVEAGLSGLEYWPQRDALVYTASVEDTSSAMADGAILGSMVGSVMVRALDAQESLDLRSSTLVLRDRSGQPRRTKVESLACIRADAHRFEGILTTDNDNGQAGFMRIVLADREKP